MELIDRYNELYDVMATSGEPEKMKIFGEAERWAFTQLAGSHAPVAEQWLARLEAVDWNNYLTEGEANEATAALMSREGKRGPMWSPQQVRDVAAASGGKTEYPPFYNFGALYATMNMLASDHMDSLSAVLSAEKVPPLVYAMAVEKLTDPDRRSFVRPYFGL